jgi:hypothetical protein
MHHIFEMDSRNHFESLRRNLLWLLPCIGILILLPQCNRESPDILFVPYTWEFGTPEEAGMNKQILDSAFNFASQKEYVDGLLIVRHGKIVAEEYYNGFTKDHPHNIMSVSKSMLSAITGIVLYGNYGLDLEDRMLDYFPEYVTDDLDQRKHDITIGHLLTMRMGRLEEL